jgi:hypothetical protein
VVEEVNRVPDRSVWLGPCVIDWKRLYQRHVLSLLINMCQFFLTSVDQLFFFERAAVDQLDSKKIESNNAERSQHSIWFITNVWNRYCLGIVTMTRLIETGCAARRSHSYLSWPAALLAHVSHSAGSMPAPAPCTLLIALQTVNPA